MHLPRARRRIGSGLAGLLSALILASVAGVAYAISGGGVPSFLRAQQLTLGFGSPSAVLTNCSGALCVNGSPPGVQESTTSATLGNATACPVALGTGTLKYVKIGDVVTVYSTGWNCQISTAGYSLTAMSTIPTGYIPLNTQSCLELISNVSDSVVWVAQETFTSSGSVSMSMGLSSGGTPEAAWYGSKAACSYNLL